MYGMVNRAIEGLLTEEFGAEAWARVCERAGVEIPVFVSSDPYPDALTYGLVAAASEELALPAAEFLRRFGSYWILRTAAESYSDLMDAGGRSLDEFLARLPDFHTRVQLAFPSLKPPVFRVLERGPGRMLLRYESSREGLAPFVEGLLEGLGARFGVEVSSRRVALREEGAGHDEFLVEWSGRGAGAP